MTQCPQRRQQPLAVLLGLVSSAAVSCQQSPPPLPPPPSLDSLARLREHSEDDGSRETVAASTFAASADLAEVGNQRSRCVGSHVADWASALLLVESRGPVTVMASKGDMVEIEIPCRMRIDDSAVPAWVAEFASRAEARIGNSTPGRLLFRAETRDGVSPTSPLPDCGSPIMRMSALDISASEEGRWIGLIVADAAGWGASAQIFRLPVEELDGLLEAMVQPRTLEMLAVRGDEVVHGASLPLLPCSFAGPGRPQFHASPWWIRDRQDHATQERRWRNASTWLAPARQLANAMRGVPDTVGDIIFLPMLAMQPSMTSDQFAVGSIDLKIRATLPGELVSTIERFEFRVTQR